MTDRRRVLVADPDAERRTCLQRLLVSWGYHVVVAEDGCEARRLLALRDAPWLALLDARIPGVDMKNVCRLIRSLDHLHYVYTVVMSDEGTVDDRVRALEAGADDCVECSIDPCELRARLAAGNRIVSLQEHLVRTHGELYEQATRDCLTGLWNRTAIVQILEREIARANRGGTPLGVVLADIDQFKRINDNYGHLPGDEVLCETAHRMSAVLRKYDSIGRYGGDEFLIVVPGCQLSGSLAVAERLREAAAGRTTASFGLAWTSKPGPADATRLLRQADEALYAAKRGGRNRVEVFGMADCGAEGAAVVAGAGER